MHLYPYLDKNVEIKFDDETVYGKVVGYTSADDNEPDDAGNYGGEYVTIKVSQPTGHFEVGEQFSAFLYEIKSIKATGI
ncbi:hypothetical protein ACFQ4L_08560 [Lapidilactobacillus mulanensis]|uniref:Uncharacterized protein n=1 Tax=Lapidilactobacillus mulanensis TaxID=2485999 RepID=A0ABW4DS84_9LACO|nr:hypothetical protein [Lapidilactobacillus mulanensis]